MQFCTEAYPIRNNQTFIKLIIESMIILCTTRKDIPYIYMYLRLFSI